MTTKLLPSALLLSLTALLYGCGGDKPAQSNTAQGAAPEMTTKTEPTDFELAEKQELVISNGSEPESLDPHKVSGVPESNIIRQLLVGLTSVDKDGKVIAGMATEWTSPDNKVWTFKLRDAKWSNGDPVTAEDFVYSFRRVVTPETASPYSSYLAEAKVLNAQEIVDGKVSPDTLGVKAIDDKTLEVTLSEPVPYFPSMLIHTSTKPVNAKVVKEFGDKWTSVANFVGNGPYKPTDWVVNEQIVLERNPNYFDNDKTTINKVTLLAIPSATTEVSRYKAGELDITSGVPIEQFQALKAELGQQVEVSPNLCTYYYEFNHTKAPFDDVRVRKALSMVFDRETVVNGILKMGQTPAYQYTHVATDGMKNYEPEWKSWDKAKRVEEAKKLLNEAGFNEQNPLKFELLYNTSDSHRTLAVAASSFWKDALGFVEVNLNNQEWKTYLEARRQGKHQVARGGWCADYNEPSTFLNTFLSTSSNNNGKYSSSEFDKLMLDSLGADISPEQRAQIYHDAEAVLDKDAATIFAYHYVNVRLVKPHVMGLSVKDPLTYWQAKDLKIAKH